MRYGMIMAGGAGTRLWPMSRRSRPKQLLPLFEGRCLLELAAARLEGVVESGRRLVCTAERYRAMVRSALPEFTDDRILGEPVGRNTANAVGLTAAVLARRDPGAVFAVLTADHVIEPEDEFRRRLDAGLRLVEEDPTRFVTFAITPSHPATAYGYVERGAPIPGHEGAFRAAHFAEKPDRPTAERYIASGRFGWNSGSFVFGAAAFTDALERHLPESHAGLARIAEAWDTPRRRAVLDEVYPALPSESVDVAIMEPAIGDPALTVCCLPVNVSWRDVGSWPSYGETLDADAAGCRTNANVALHVGSRNVLAVSDDPAHLIATVGLENVIIVHTADATLICRADRAEEVKELVERVPEELR